MCFQSNVKRALTKTLQAARASASFPLGTDERYVIFSDQHKGGRTLADDFLACEHTYRKALEFYYRQGYTLVVLGDVEELWEEDPQTVLDSYREVFELEAEFYRDDRYLRIYGNHDNFWHLSRNVKTHLDPFFPGITPVDGAVLAFSQGESQVGEILLVHGNQGIFDIGAISNFSRIVVRIFWRTFQKLTGRGRTTPAEDACLRGRHDTWMYNWADEQNRLILVAGHTHRPIWSSMTHLEQLRNQLFTLQCAAPRPEDYQTQLAQLQAEIHKRMEQHPPCNDTFKTNPCYFNTGCCSFSDGDITGIELDGGLIRLIKWEQEDGSREELQSARLADLFHLL